MFPPNTKSTADRATKTGDVTPARTPELAKSGNLTVPGDFVLTEHTFAVTSPPHADFSGQTAHATPTDSSREPAPLLTCSANSVSVMLFAVACTESASPVLALRPVSQTMTLEGGVANASLKQTMCVIVAGSVTEGARIASRRVS